MRPDETLYLMYHELETPGRPLCHSEPGYVRYILGEQNFREQIDWLRKEGMRGLSVSDSLAEDHPRVIVLTFDDGCESDLSIAAPILKQAGFSATFYITLGFLGQRGYLVPRQVRELGDAGFEIGCHSMTHAYLNDLDAAGLRREIADAKTQLEDILGRPVHHFSCPGGRWSANVVQVAREAGYRSVASSRIGANRRGSDPFHLARVAVMRGTPLAAFQSLCEGRTLWQLQLREMIRVASRRVLGNTLYDRLRSAALESSPPSEAPRT
ncbi:MAG TPA: polysaccharide deacetylase family protein [Candidatus Binatus sp.]|jgi:peptidoglycan/xylan/chitin deacetylase (PgdA/CDA1 family)|nr:polysaccharide deacetylase family protein [Candidatus Binatus sp.]